MIVTYQKITKESIEIKKIPWINNLQTYVQYAQ